MLSLVLVICFASLLSLAKAAPMSPYKSGWFNGSGSNHPNSNEHYPAHSQHENTHPTYTNEYQGNQFNPYNPDSSVYVNQPYYNNQPAYGTQPYYPPYNPTDQSYNNEYYGNEGYNNGGYNNEGYTNPDYTTSQHNQEVVYPTGNKNVVDLASLPAYNPYVASPEHENVNYDDLQELMREQSAERQRSSSSHRHQRKGKEPASQSKEKTSFLGRLWGGGSKNKEKPSRSTPQPAAYSNYAKQDSFDKSIDTHFDIPSEEDGDEANDEVTSYQRFEPENSDEPNWGSMSYVRQRRITGVLKHQGGWTEKKERLKLYQYITENIARKLESRNDDVKQDGIWTLRTLVQNEAAKREKEMQRKLEAREEKQRQKQVDSTKGAYRRGAMTGWDLGSVNANRRFIKTIGAITGQIPSTTYKHLKEHKITSETCWAILNAPTLRDQQKIVQTFNANAFSKTEDLRGKKVRLIGDNEQSPAAFYFSERDVAQDYSTDPR